MTAPFVSLRREAGVRPPAPEQPSCACPDHDAMKNPLSRFFGHPTCGDRLRWSGHTPRSLETTATSESGCRGMKPRGRVVAGGPQQGTPHFWLVPRFRDVAVVACLGIGSDHNRVRQLRQSFQRTREVTGGASAHVGGHVEPRRSGDQERHRTVAVERGTGNRTRRGRIRRIYGSWQSHARCPPQGSPSHCPSSGIAQDTRRGRMPASIGFRESP